MKTKFIRSHPLLIATVAGREDMVDYLLEHSADPTIEAKDGYSILHGAAFSGKKISCPQDACLRFRYQPALRCRQITPTDVARKTAKV